MHRQNVNRQNVHRQNVITNGQKDQWTKGSVDKKISGQKDQWTKGSVYKMISGQIDHVIFLVVSPVVGTLTKNTW